MDRGVANLIQDLHDRGMEKDVVTVMWGEFGRTPKINGNDGGRDHWSPVMSAPGRRRRPEDGPGHRHAPAPAANTRKDRQYTRAAAAQHAVPGASASTRRMTFPNGSGRPMYILDDREPVTELL